MLYQLSYVRVSRGFYPGARNPPVRHLNSHDEPSGRDPAKRPVGTGRPESRQLRLPDDRW